MPCRPSSPSPTSAVLRRRRASSAFAIGGDAADRGAGGAAWRAAAAADHAIGDADRRRHPLSGAGPAHPCRCRGSRRRGRGRADPAQRPAGGLRAARIWTPACQPGRVGLSASAIRRCRAELRLADRMVNLVEDGVDLAVRIGTLPNSTLVARHVGEMRRIVVASKDYLKRHGAPKTPARDRRASTPSSSAPCRRSSTGALSRPAASFASTVTPRFATNSSDAAIQYAEQGGGLTRVLAYQAADGSRRAGSRSCWRNSSSRRCRSMSSIRPRGCCRPRCAPSSISSPRPTPSASYFRQARA